MTYSKCKNRGFLTYSKCKNRGFLTKQTKIFVYIKENQYLCKINKTPKTIIMIFKRKIYDKMLRWKEEQHGTTALLIRGARRIGKSTIAEEFAK